MLQIINVLYYCSYVNKTVMITSLIFGRITLTHSMHFFENANKLTGFA